MVSRITVTTALNPNQEMTDYKKYSLENLENWMHDAISVDDATPQEVYDVIIGVVKENYYMYKQQASQAYELLALLNGNGKGHIKEYDDCVDKILSCDKDDQSPECVKHWDDFWDNTAKADGYSVELPPYQSHIGWLNMNEDKFDEEFPSKDKVVKWQLPVQVDELTGDCYIELPDDLLECAGLKEGDTVEWIDRNDGSFEMRKVNGIK